jgi:acetyl esterase/lipase
VALVVVALGAALLPTVAAQAAQGQRFIDPVFADTTVTPDLIYGNAMHHGEPFDLKLDIHEPAGDSAERRPLVVWIHGGSFLTGDRAGPLEVLMATNLAQRGYVVASIGYRLASGGGLGVDWLNAYSDAQTAVAWLRANADSYRVDTSRIAVAGMSAGAMTSVSVGSQPDVLADPALLEGPSHVDAVVSLAGFGAGAWPQPGEPPVLMLHGLNDELVRHEWAEGYCVASNTNGVPCELVTYSGAGDTHVGFLVNLPDIIERTADWLYDTLDLAGWSPLTFLDVPAGAPFEDDIAWLAANDISTGYPGPEFRPGQPVTRQAMAAFLHRVHDRLAPPTTPTPVADFADVPPGAPFYDDIAWLAASGISTGYPGSPPGSAATFRPDEPVSRQAMSAFLFRLDELLAGANAASPDPGFSDVPAASAFFDEIAWMADTGITTGYPGPSFRPAESVTRQAMSAFLHRLYDHVDATPI